MAEQSETSVPTLPAVGFVRLADVLKLIPVGKSAWYAGIKEGRFPAPVKLNKRASAYRVEDIRALIERLSSGEAA
ncbi:AlpA family phage regulatory protein [uncultured Desulfovibrio sp.]|uniref:helix-turn-helix transcriptional regulator n=1 Tax=uncultured Desulfovibrio sp. TaxID=167968 RepID=UPI001C3A74A9|nr:AlpA family phage regulatory protein [uncultured Desulfovibrio sp.]HIX40860.1 AlpA family phage regulatory protein [Candidatus Desulfovibrio intestinigallinarum]